MKPEKKLSILTLSLFLLACGGGKSGEEIEKEAKESAEKAAEESFEKLNADTSGESNSTPTAKEGDTSGR